MADEIYEEFFERSVAEARTQAEAEGRILIMSASGEGYSLDGGKTWLRPLMCSVTTSPLPIEAGVFSRR